MYKFERYRQLGLADFNQPVGLKMNSENRWLKKAETIPWDAIEERYVKLFPSKTGMPGQICGEHQPQHVAAEQKNSIF